MLDIVSGGSSQLPSGMKAMASLPGGLGIKITNALAAKTIAGSVTSIITLHYLRIARRDNDPNALFWALVYAGITLALMIF
ncbi:MAG TPA: hypothetical protein DD417_11835 [Elusimicrobia bacterium]|nr:hypothetical protein [Elusimicrobiota bacterium]